MIPTPRFTSPIGWVGFNQVDIPGLNDFFIYFFLYFILFSLFQFILKFILCYFIFLYFPLISFILFYLARSESIEPVTSKSKTIIKTCCPFFAFFCQIFAGRKSILFKTLKMSIAIRRSTVLKTRLIPNPNLFCVHV